MIPFLASLQFLTLIPPIIKRPFTPKELGRAVGYYPLVGLLIGAILTGANYLFALVFPSSITTALTLAVWIGLTGVLHLDGFLDACDGLFGGFTPEKRLEIMRDECVGAFAMAGGVLLLLLKFTALDSNPSPVAALLLVPTLGRWGITLAIVAFPYARSQGLGRSFKDHATWRQVALATGIAVPSAWFIAQWIGLAAMGLTAALVWAGSRFTLRRIPGLTGDIYGALNELVEVALLLVLVII